MRKVNVTIVTGTRAEFGIWQPVLRAIQQSKKLHLQLVVTGMHLQKDFGYTIDDIKKSGISIGATVRMYAPGDSSADSLARATAALAKTYKTLNSDLVMVLGDRLEILAAAGAALACQIPVAHLHGGETAPGQWDEQIRHAVTKIAHLHFAATKKSAARIRQMGEDPKTIHIVGAPAIDTALDATHSHPRSAFSVQRSALVLLHPSSPNEAIERKCALHVLHALRAADVPFTAIGPNNDPGHRGILRAYQDGKVSLTMNLSQSDFWELLQQSAFLIGNSSCGIIEAATFGVPVINLGDRQKGRERNANVIDVPWSAGGSGIEKAIHRALTDKSFRAKVAQRRNLYGDGRAAQRVVKVLESVGFPLATSKAFHEGRARGRRASSNK